MVCRLVGAQRDPESVPVRRQLHAARDLRFRPIYMVVDDRIGERQNERGAQTDDAHQCGQKANSQRARAMQSRMHQAARMPIPALVADLPIALKHKVEQKVFGLQAKENRQSGDGIKGHEWAKRCDGEPRQQCARANLSVR